MISTVEDFLAKNTISETMAKYARSLCTAGSEFGKLWKTGFLVWEEETAYMWAGPWGESHVFFKIVDHRFCPDLQTEEELVAKYRKQVRYSVYKKPARLTAGLDRDIYSVDGHIYKRSMITHEERLAMMALMTHDELLEHEAQLKKCDDAYAIENGWCGQATVERPISLYLAGTDDASETALFLTIASAEAALFELAADPTPATLKRLGFQFTN